MSTWIKRAALIAAASLALTGAAAAEVVYNRANSGEPETLDTHKTSTVQEVAHPAGHARGPRHLQRQGRSGPRPGSKNGKSATTARPTGSRFVTALKWSNGDPVKASDFVYSYRRIMNPETGAKYANILYPILNAEKINKGQGKLEDLGVKAVDDKTLEIKLEQPTPYFIELLTHQTSLPVHPASVEKFGKDFVKPGNLVSNGAYKLAEFVPNSHIKLVKNDTYYDAKNVQIDTVNYFPTPDFAAMVRRYEAGELDTTDDVPADQMKSLKQRFGNQVQLGPYLGSWYMVVNSSKAPFNDVRVRQALSMVIDREFIAEQIWGQTMQPGLFVHAPRRRQLRRPGLHGLQGHVADRPRGEGQGASQGSRFRPGQAAEGRDPLQHDGQQPEHRRSPSPTSGSRSASRRSFINTDGKTHFAHLRDGGDFDVARYGWIADYSDPQNFLFLLAATTRASTTASTTIRSLTGFCARRPPSST